MNLTKDIRQGDVLVAPTTEHLPKDAVEIPMDGERLVLAYGEVTGHAHAMYDIRNNGTQKAKLFQSGKKRYLQVVETVSLRHEEHTKHEIPPGIYKLPVQFEYEPKELRRVID